MKSNRCRYVEGRWIPSGKAERPPSNAIYVHNESPNFGAHWMKEPVNFSKLKLSNKKSEPGMVSACLLLSYLVAIMPSGHQAMSQQSRRRKKEPYVACLDSVQFGIGRKGVSFAEVDRLMPWWLPWYFVTLIAFDRRRPCPAWESVCQHLPRRIRCVQSIDSLLNRRSINLPISVECGFHPTTFPQFLLTSKYRCEELIKAPFKQKENVGTGKFPFWFPLESPSPNSPFLRLNFLIVSHADYAQFATQVRGSCSHCSSGNRRTADFDLRFSWNPIYRCHGLPESRGMSNHFRFSINWINQKHLFCQSTGNGSENQTQSVRQSISRFERAIGWQWRPTRWSVRRWCSSSFDGPPSVFSM